MNPLYVESQMLKVLKSDNHQTKNRISKKLTECVFVLFIFNSLIINLSFQDCTCQKNSNFHILHNYTECTYFCDDNKFTREMNSY